MSVKRPERVSFISQTSGCLSLAQPGALLMVTVQQGGSACEALEPAARGRNIGPTGPSTPPPFEHLLCAACWGETREQNVFPLIQEKARQNLPHDGIKSAIKKKTKNPRHVKVYLCLITQAPPVSASAPTPNLSYSGIWGSEH